MTPGLDDVSAALETLFLRFTEVLHSAGRRRGLSGAELDELVQDVRIRLWRALETNEKISAVTASYLYQTARSAAIDLIRRRRSKQEFLEVGVADPDDPIGGIPAGGPTQLEAVAQQDVGRQLDAAVAGLAESRSVVVRMYLAGYPREEIAELLGWSEAKTRNLLYRGLDDLRNRLSALGIGPESGA